MPTPVQARQSNVSAIVALGCVLFMLMPVLGLYFVYLRPPGLIAPPPISLQRIIPLLGRTLALATCVSVFSLALGTWLSWTFERCRFRGRSVLATLCVLPLATPSYITAAIVREQMAPGGSIGSFLGLSGLFTGFWPAVLVLTISCTPYVLILMNAAFARCPVAEEEAARILGAGPWRRFKTVLLPRLRPSLAFSLVLICMYVVSDFGAVAVMNCEVLTWELYKVRGSKDAVVLGFGLIALVVPLLMGVRLLHGRSQLEVGVTNRWFYRTPLSGWSLGATWFFALSLVGLGVFIPVVTLINWFVAGLKHAVTFAPVFEPALNTIMYSAIGGVVVILAALAPAYLNSKKDRNSTKSKALETLVYLTSSVPGVLIAVGLLQLFIGLKRVVPVNFAGQSVWTYLEGFGIFLMFGYITRFLSTAYAALKPAFLRVDSRQQESARILGATGLRLWKTITFPALKPGIGAAYLLIFLSIAKELPITLMLMPLGKTTLAYRIFDAQQESALPDVGLAGIALLSLALGLHWFVLRWRRDV